MEGAHGGYRRSPQSSRSIISIRFDPMRWIGYEQFAFPVADTGLRFPQRPTQLLYFQNYHSKSPNNSNLRSRTGSQGSRHYRPTRVPGLRVWEFSVPAYRNATHPE